MSIFSMDLLSKVVVGGLVVCAPMMQSCSDEEIAVGAAVVAVGAAVSAGSGHGRCSYRDTVCSYHTNYYGERVRTCRQVTRRHRCGRRYILENDSFASNQAAEYTTFNQLADQPVTEYLDVTDLAKHYYLSLDAAERFVNALELSRQGDLTEINALGLDSDDMQELAQLKVPGDYSIDRLARNLDQDPVLTKGMLSKIVVYGHKLKREECERLEEEGGSASFSHYCTNL